MNFYLLALLILFYVITCCKKEFHNPYAPTTRKLDLSTYYYRIKNKFIFIYLKSDIAKIHWSRAFRFHKIYVLSFLMLLSVYFYFFYV